MVTAPLLIICTDEGRRDRFASALSGEGWQGIVSASSLAAATSLIRDTPNGCAIIDAELADMAGLKAVEVLQQLCPHVKIIFTAPANSRELETQVRALNVFYYYISSADPGELVAAVREAIGAPRPVRAGHAPRVLIVDDDHDFQTILRAVLEPAGYRILSAYDQREGLDMARRERPDVVLLDIIMSSSTEGFEFCREARRDPRLKHTPIIGISAVEEKIVLRCPPDRDGDIFPVNGYLRKPVATEQLFALLRRLVPAEG